MKAISVVFFEWFEIAWSDQQRRSHEKCIAVSSFHLATRKQRAHCVLGCVENAAEKRPNLWGQERFPTRGLVKILK